MAHHVLLIHLRGCRSATDGFRYDVGMVLNCTAPVTLHKLGRWKTAELVAHMLTQCLVVTGLTLPESNQTILVATTSVDLAAGITQNTRAWSPDSAKVMTSAFGMARSLPDSARLADNTHC